MPELDAACSFTITTANTHFSRAIATSESAHLLAGSDILLAQEVLELPKDTLLRNIGSIGLSITIQNEEAGLTIAASDRFTKIKGEYFCIQPAGRLADTANRIGLKQRLRERGLLIAKLRDELTGDYLTVATAHPIVCLRAVSRAQQVRRINAILTQRHAVGPLVLGADLNHYPEANKVDKQLAAGSRLKPVSNTDPTCLLINTRHSWLRYLGVHDARLDSLMFRGLTEISSEVTKIASDHLALKGVFDFIDRTSKYTP